MNSTADEVLLLFYINISIWGACFTQLLFTVFVSPVFAMHEKLDKNDDVSLLETKFGSTV